jgi:hypothetical protein
LDDVEGDVELVHWSLQPEDYNYKARVPRLSPRLKNNMSSRKRMAMIHLGISKIQMFILRRAG